MTTTLNLWASVKIGKIPTATEVPMAATAGKDIDSGNESISIENGPTHVNDATGNDNSNGPYIFGDDLYTPREEQLDTTSNYTLNREA
jgi:hypothetical protein